MAVLTVTVGADPISFTTNAATLTLHIVSIIATNNFAPPTIRVEYTRIGTVHTIIVVHDVVQRTVALSITSQERGRRTLLRTIAAVACRRRNGWRLAGSLVVVRNLTNWGFRSVT